MDQLEYSSVPLYSMALIKEKDIRYPVSKMDNEVFGAAALRAYLQDKDCEHMAVLMVDGANNFIGIHLVALGSLSRIPAIYIRDIFKAAIAGRANAIVLGHNHPSGDVLPSNEDIAFTKLAYQASNVIGVPILDHLIISSGMNDDVYSFFAHGHFNQ